MKVQVERNRLHGHSIGFRPQTQKLELSATLQNSITHSGSQRVKQRTEKVSFESSYSKTPQTEMLERPCRCNYSSGAVI